MANKLYLKKRIYTLYMEEGKEFRKHIYEFNKVIFDFNKIDIKNEDGCQVIILVNS